MMKVIIGFEEAKLLTEYLRQYSKYQNLFELPYGAIVGKVDLTDCKKQMLVMEKWHEITMTEIDWGEYSDINTRFAWRTANPVVFPEPIRAKGSQGLWNSEVQIMTPYEELANAIVLQAVKDYRLHDDEKELTSIERFFRSGWFGVLTSLDPEMLIAKLRKEKVRYEY